MCDIGISIVAPAGIRRQVLFAPELCTGSATCVYVCRPAALQVNALKECSDEAHYEWNYDPGQCTFCGRCVEVCPSHALEMAADRPPVYRKMVSFNTMVTSVCLQDSHTNLPEARRRFSARPGEGKELYRRLNIRP